MKAVRYLGNHQVAVEEIPDPTPGFGEVLLKPLAVGICGTDLHILEGDYASAPPMTLGHEVCAEVIGLGEGVQKLQVGDLISIEPHIYCSVCVYCQTGDLHMCPNRKAPGVHMDGGMAELMVAPESIAYKLEPGIHPGIGSMTEPLACVVHGIDRLQAKSGRAIAVFGAGPAGNLVIALAKQAGLYPVVAVEMREQRRELALRMGAHVALDPTADDFTERMMELTDGDGFPYLVDAVGSSRVLEQAIPLASRKGTILVFGVARPDDRLTVSPNEIYAKELTILGTALNPHTHRRAANLVNHIGLDNFEFGYFTMDQIEEGLQAQRDGAFDKVFIIPNGALA